MTQTLHNTIFGELTLNAKQGCWQGKLFLDIVNQEVVLSFDGSDDDGPTQQQTALCTAFQLSSVSLRPTLQEALYQHYQGTRELLLRVMPEETTYFEYLMPVLSQEASIWELVTAAELLVLSEPASADGELFLYLKCTWDVEHGLSAAFQDGRLISVDL